MLTVEDMRQGEFGKVAANIEAATDEKARILVVDDENGPRQSLRMLLKDEYEVFLADDVAQARDFLGESPVDLVITDLRMPRESGVSLLQWVKEKFSDTEVIILTGYGQLDTAVKAVEYGAFAYLEKPYDTEEMMRHIREAIDKRRRVIERRQLEAMALEANRFETLGRFVSGMLHDLGTPLSVVGSHLELMLQAPQRAPQEETYKVMYSQVQYCSDVVRAAMNFLRHESDVLVRLSLNDVADVCLHVGQPLFTRQGVVVERLFAAGLPACKGDFVLVRQAILNLITNACQAMENNPRPSQLKMQTWSDEDSVYIGVADTGPGVPEHVRKKVFNTFFSTKGKHGTGLGLAAVKHIMRRHGGDVFLRENAGGGALFVLRFPRDASNGQAH